MSFLESIEKIDNLQDPEYAFLVSELFNPLDAVNREDLGPFPNITAKRTDIIARFIKTYKTHIGNDIYPTVRLIMPDKDYRKYYVRHTELVSLIIKMYDLPKQSNQAKLLREWKSQYHNLQKQNSNLTLSQLPIKICQVVANRRGVNHKINKRFTVDEINHVLDQLSLKTKADERIELLKPVFDEFKIDELRWFLNDILKISNVGYMEKTVFAMWHPSCYALYTICHDLSKCFRYFSVNDTIDAQLLNPQVNYAFTPQASHKLTDSYSKLCSKMKEFYIEEKIDGDRMVLHFDNDNFKFYSRRCRDYSLLFGENFETGSLSKHLRGAFHPSIKKLILDGEIVAYDIDRKCILPFGTLRKAAIQEAVRDFTTTDMFSEHGCWPYLLVFDILQVNDKSLVDVLLKQRKEILEKVVRPVPHRLEILPYKLCNDPLDIDNAVKGVIVDRSEGIMVKNVKSKYHVAKRDNSWIKVKPEYLEQFGENLDLVVIGIIPAIKNSYMCGLYDEKESIWRSFCTVANGFTNQEFADLDRILRDKIVHEKPDNVKFGKRKPQYYLRPENSIVLEIKARVYDQRTDGTYATNSTLRNLYCRGIRYDKSYEDCILYETYEGMKLDRTKGMYEAQDVVQKRRKLKQDSLLETSFKSKMKSQTDLFKNFVFIILSDKLDQIENVRIPIKDLKRFVKQFGGQIQNAPSEPDRTVILSEKLTPSCKKYVNLGFDIIHPDWVLHCIENDSIIPLEQLIVFQSNRPIVENSDEFGDSYAITPRINFGDYLLLLNIPRSNAVVDIDEEINSVTLLKDLFASSRFLILDLGVHSVRKALEIKICQFNGKIATGVPVEYIIVPTLIYQRFRDKVMIELKRINESITKDYKQGDKIPNTVMESFIDNCINHKIKVDPADHKVL